MPQTKDLVLAAVVLVVLFGIVEVVLLSIDVNHQLRTVSVVVNDATACDTSQPCLVGVTRTGGYCEYHPATKTTACTSVCHVDGAATHCDAVAAGPQCVSDDVTDCLGACVNTDDVYTGDCSAATIPINAHWLTPASPGGLDFFFLNDALCFAGTCVRVGIQLLAISDGGGAFTSYGLPATTCAEMLDTSESTSACITAYPFSVDTLFKQTDFQDYFSWPANYLPRGCAYRYACAPLNNTALLEAVGGGRRRAVALAAYEQVLMQHATDIREWLLRRSTQ
jgi:hypothetical protein